MEEGGNGVLPMYTTLPSYFAEEAEYAKSAIVPESWDRECYVSVFSVVSGIN